MQCIATAPESVRTAVMERSQYAATASAKAIRSGTLQVPRGVKDFFIEHKGLHAISAVLSLLLQNTKEQLLQFHPRSIKLSWPLDPEQRVRSIECFPACFVISLTCL